MADSDPFATFTAAAGLLDRFGLAYLHLVLPGSSEEGTEAHRMLAELRRAFHGPLVVNGGYTREAGDAVLAAGLADLVSFGTPFLANPDLPARFAAGAPLNAPDPKTFYGGGAEGYVDYPALAG
jgi:N-ethylmaleimide reductase